MSATPSMPPTRPDQAPSTAATGAGAAGRGAALGVQGAGGDEVVLVSFASTHQAFAFEDAALAAGLPGRLLPLPAAISASCGLAWTTPPGAPGLASFLCPPSHTGGGPSAAAPAYAAVYRVRELGRYHLLGAGPDAIGMLGEDGGSGVPRGLAHAVGIDELLATTRPGDFAWKVDAPIGSRTFHANSPAPDVPGLCVAVVGAGGKTSTIHALADELAGRGLRVAITTTTHMFVEPGMVTDVAEAAARLRAGPGVVVAGIVGTKSTGSGTGTADNGVGQAGGRRFTGFPDPGLATLVSCCDVVLVEADGSKQLPFKIPAGHEPVIPPQTDLVVVVEGLSAIGRPVAEVCARAELIPELLAGEVDADPPADVTPDLAARLIRLGYLRNPALARWAPGRIVVILNQADTEPRHAAGRRIATALSGVPVVISSWGAALETSAATDPPRPTEEDRNAPF